MLIGFDAKHPGKQFFSNVGKEPPLPVGITSTFGGGGGGG